MAIYKIFPEKDATIYSAYPAKNTGLDEILEVSVKNSEDPTNSYLQPLSGSISSLEDIRRSLISFKNSDINTALSIISGSWKSYLRLYLANAENLTDDYSLEIKQISQNWNMGTGHWADFPETRNGVCWSDPLSYDQNSSSSLWNTSGVNYSQYSVPGGGNWSNVSSSITFERGNNLDINVDVSNIVSSWTSGSTNCGILLKHPNNIESLLSSYIVLSYFSADTHTIYPPCLEFRWDDSVILSSSLSEITYDNSTISIIHQEEYKENSIIKFTVKAKEIFPRRVFSTSSLYTNFKLLPTSSYWAIQDLKTEEMIIDFDSNYTKLSRSSNENYFRVYANGLQPERSYKILIKSIFSDGTIKIWEEDNYFKIVR